MKKRITKYDGGLSEGVCSHYRFQKYVSSDNPFGYIGTRERSKRKDKIVEKALRETGLEDGGVAVWLTSTDARHLMDDPPRKIKDFEKHVKEYTKDAFINVVIWSHPDHRGTLGSTQELKKKIFGEKNNE